MGPDDAGPAAGGPDHGGLAAPEGELSAVVLAAGAGTRLRPLTLARPKPLCTVAGRPLLDWAIDRVRPYARQMAVNVHAHAPLMLAALRDRGVHVSPEEPVALGTAGALGQLREWLDGHAVLLTNADAWYPEAGAEAVAELVDGWDGERPRLLCIRTSGGDDYGGLRYVGTSLLPWETVRDLEPVPSGLHEVSWSRLFAAGRLDLVEVELAAVDCGTPGDYLRANMAATGGRPALEAGAVVEGTVERSVVWAGERVPAGEHLVDAIRGAGTTLYPWDGHDGTGRAARGGE